MGKIGNGRLARSGKVKFFQTPKVEKQDKEKPKTGRAKKKNLYNKKIDLSTQEKNQKKFIFKSSF